MKPGKLKHYKPSRYRPHKKPIDRRVLAVIISAIAILALSIGLGAYLNTLTSSLPDTDTQNTEDTNLPSITTPYDAYPKLPIEPMAASPFPAEGYISDAEADRAIMRACGSLVHALCLNLTDQSGKPTYKSAVYEKALSAQSGQIELSVLIDKATKNGVAITASMPLLSRFPEHSDVKSVRESLELCIIEEAYRAGVRELVLCVPVQNDPEQMYSFICTVKASSPELRVGICTPPSEKTQDPEYMAKLDDIFDFIAIDFSEAFAADAALSAPAAEGEGTLENALAKNTYSIERYPARIYLNAGDGCTHCMELAKSVLSRMNITSYMLTLSEPLHKDETKS